MDKKNVAHILKEYNSAIIKIEMIKSAGNEQNWKNTIDWKLRS